jgi:transposase
VTSPADDPLPEDVETLKAMLLAERSARRTAEAQAHERALQIEKLKHTIAKLRHERFGQSAERRALLDQLELQLVELPARASSSTSRPWPTGSAHRRRP